MINSSATLYCTTCGLGYLLCDQTTDYLTLDQAVAYAVNSADHALKTSNHDGEPNSYHEAMQCPPEERAHWHKASQEEIQALIENGTFELVQLLAVAGCSR